jgi:hypothetical protein
MLRDLIDLPDSFTEEGEFFKNTEELENIFTH